MACRAFHSSIFHGPRSPQYAGCPTLAMLSHSMFLLPVHYLCGVNVSLSCLIHSILHFFVKLYSSTLRRIVSNVFSLCISAQLGRSRRRNWLEHGSLWAHLVLLGPLNVQVSQISCGHPLSEGRRVTAVVPSVLCHSILQYLSGWTP